MHRYKTQARCRHEIMGDILGSLVKYDTGKGVTPSRLRLGRHGALNYDRLKPWLERLDDAGFVSSSPGRSKGWKLYRISPKGTLWVSRFNQLEEMIGEGR